MDHQSDLVRESLALALVCGIVRLMVNHGDRLNRMAVELGHYDLSAGKLGQPARDRNVLVCKIPARGQEFGIIYQAISYTALVGYEIVAPGLIKLTLNLGPGEVQDVFV
jgi:hypothetical protein